MKHSQGRGVLIPGHGSSVHVKLTLSVPLHANIHLSREYVEHDKANQLCSDSLAMHLTEYTISLPCPVHRGGTQGIGPQFRGKKHVFHI